MLHTRGKHGFEDTRAHHPRPYSRWWLAQADDSPSRILPSPAWLQRYCHLHLAATRSDYGAKG